MEYELIYILRHLKNHFITFINPLWKQNIVLKPTTKHLQRYLNCINYGEKIMNIVLTRLNCILKVNCTRPSNDVHI